MVYFNNLYLVLAIFFFVGCSSSTDGMEDNTATTNPVNTFEWTVDKSKLSGADDPFPFAEHPSLTSVSNISGLNDDDTVVLISFEEEIRAYPYKFMTPYEVVNDTLNGKRYAVTYCPVTESGLCADNSKNEFDLALFASGFRYKDNLISKDEKTASYWSQMLMKCVKGPFENQYQKTFPMIETSWKTVKDFFPEARVFNQTSIAAKNYSKQLKPTDDIGADERVFGILDTRDSNQVEVFIYRYSNFNNSIELYQNVINNSSTIIVGSSNLDFIIAYEDDKNSTFIQLQNEFPIVMMDASGSKWNIFGRAIDGPRKGEQLSAPKSYVASWWAWKDFYTNFTFITS